MQSQRELIELPRSTERPFLNLNQRSKPTDESRTTQLSLALTSERQYGQDMFAANSYDNDLGTKIWFYSEWRRHFEFDERFM